MSNLQSQLLLAGAAFMACAMLSQAVPVVHPGLVHPGFGLGLHPFGLHPVGLHPFVHPVKQDDINNDGVPDILDNNLDGKVDHPLLYPINVKIPSADINNDRVPDVLDANLDGKPDSGVLAPVHYSPFLVHAVPAKH